MLPIIEQSLFAVAFKMIGLSQYLKKNYVKILNLNKKYKLVQTITLIKENFHETKSYKEHIIKNEENT